MKLCIKLENKITYVIGVGTFATLKQITRIYTYVANQQMHPNKMWFIRVHYLVCYMSVNVP